MSTQVWLSTLFSDLIDNHGQQTNAVNMKVTHAKNYIQ
jgi:hypothetical protein